MKYVIIGGVAGGATAAARLRRVDETADILLLEKGPHISYANCGLPYYIGGVIVERERLLVQTPESFSKRFRIDVRVQNEVLAIHPKTKTLTIRNVGGEEYEENYDKLLLSPGANPVKPPLEGIHSEGIFTLRNVEDTDSIKAYITSHHVKRAVVVGAGFIGLEMVDNLHHAGIAVSIVEKGNQVMAPIDFSMAAYIHQHLSQKGVSLYLEEGVAHFRHTEQGITVFLKSGKAILADMVLLSIGVRPATALAQQAGLKLGETGGIWVDEHLETSEKDIYAVGDAIEYILIAQLDTYIFRDELHQWCAKGYDYVGAPWIVRDIYRNPLMRLCSKIKKCYCDITGKPNSQITGNKVGNGGLSLRKVESHIRATKQLRALIEQYLSHEKYHLFNEDVFFAIEPNRNGLDFKYPDYLEALKFSFDKHPAYCYKKNGNQLPFGCHGWNKKRMIKFWKKIIPEIGN